MLSSLTGTKKKQVTSKKPHSVNPHETVEAVRSIPKNIGKTFMHDVLGGGKNDILSQLLGYESQTIPKTGDMRAGQEVNLKQNKSEAQLKPIRIDAAPAMDYHREIARAGERLGIKETTQMQRDIQQIMVELKKLVDTSAVLQAQFVEVTVEQGPVNPGKYHKNFFEWMLIMIRTAREKVQDSGAWMAALQ